MKQSDFESRQIETARQLDDDSSELKFYSSPSYEKRGVDGDGDVVFVVSTIAEDSYRSILNVRGMDWTSRFYNPNEKKNPIILYDHYDVVGQAKWIKFGNQERTEVISSPSFSKATQVSREVEALVKDDTLRAASVGFYAKQNLFDDDAKQAFEEDYSDLDLKASSTLEWYVRKPVLVEWSVVRIGANHEALKKSLDTICPELRMAFVADQLEEKVESLSKSIQDVVTELAKEKTDRANDLKQLAIIFARALQQRDEQIRDAKRKPEALGLKVDVESAINSYINKRKGIIE